MQKLFLKNNHAVEVNWDDYSTWKHFYLRFKSWKSEKEKNEFLIALHEKCLNSNFEMSKQNNEKAEAFGLWNNASEHSFSENVKQLILTSITIQNKDQILLEDPVVQQLVNDTWVNRSMWVSYKDFMVALRKEREKKDVISFSHSNALQALCNKCSDENYTIAKNDLTILYNRFGLIDGEGNVFEGVKQIVLVCCKLDTEGTLIEIHQPEQLEKDAQNTSERVETPKPYFTR